MNELLENLDMYKRFIKDQVNKEIYILSSVSTFIDCTDKTLDIQKREVKGISLRSPIEACCEFTYVDGISKKSLISLRTQSLNKHLLPLKFRVAMDDGYRIPVESISWDNRNDELISEEYVRKLWKFLSNVTSNYNEKLAKVNLQYQHDMYFILTSNGFEGYLTRMIYATGYEVKERSTSYYGIFPHTFDPESEQHIHASFHDTKINKEIGTPYVQYMLYTGSAIAKILYFLSFIMTDEILTTGQSLFTINDIGKKLFSTCLSLVENSNENEIISGTTDGDCARIAPTYIIKDGVFKSIIKTGSSHRFSHKVPPQVHPAKMSVLGSMTCNQILEVYDNIAIITDLIGITESMNPRSTEFSAYANAIYYRNGIAVGSFRLDIKTSAVSLLNNIECISSDGVYGADGSLYSGSFLIHAL